MVPPTKRRLLLIVNHFQLSTNNRRVKQGTFWTRLQTTSIESAVYRERRHGLLRPHVVCANSLYYCKLELLNVCASTNGGGSRVAEVERRRPGVSPPHSHGAQARTEYLDRLCSGKTQKDPCSFQGMQVYYFQSLNRKFYIANQ